MVLALEREQAGLEVPDEFLLTLIVERSRCLRCKGGFVLNGFPRTAAQAGVLNRLLTGQDVRLNAILCYELPVEILVARLCGRRVCPACLANFHLVTQPPRRLDYCDWCGVRLIQRATDQPENIRRQWLEYQLSTGSLLDFYRQHNLLYRISAEGSAEEVFERTLIALQNRQR